MRATIPVAQHSDRYNLARFHRCHASTTKSADRNVITVLTGWSAKEVATKYAGKIRFWR